MKLKDYFKEQLENPQIITEEFYSELENKEFHKYLSDKKYYSGTDIKIGDKFISGLKRIKSNNETNQYVWILICVNDDSDFENYMIDEEYVYNKEKFDLIENKEHFNYYPIIRLKIDEVIETCRFKMGDKVKTTKLEDQPDSIWSETNAEIHNIRQMYNPDDFNICEDYFEIKLESNGHIRMAYVNQLIKI